MTQPRKETFYDTNKRILNPILILITIAPALRRVLYYRDALRGLLTS